MNFLVWRNMFHQGDEGIPHCHVVGIGLTSEANGRLGIYGSVEGRSKVRVLEGGV